MKLTSAAPRRFPGRRGMAVNVINVGRRNQRYPTKDLYILNNFTTAIALGAVMILSWTPEGTDHAFLLGSTSTIIQSHQKAVCMDSGGVAVGAVGRFRVQGQCQVRCAANGTYSAEDPLFVLDTSTTGVDLTLKSAANQTLGSSSALTPASATAFVVSTAGSSSSVGLVSCVFDGTAVNSNQLIRS